MRYSRYFKATIGGFGLALIGFLLIFLFQLGAPTNSSTWIDDIYKIKTDLATSIQEPKLVVVGGSESLFGISCQLIHQRTGYPCVNGATHAGLGAPYILNRSRSWLKAGDTVLVTLPYGLYGDDGIPRETLIDYVVSRSPADLLSIHPLQSLRIVFGISFSRLMLGTINQIIPPIPRLQAYQAETLNEFGDETNNRIQDLDKDTSGLRPFANPYGYIQSSQGMKAVEEFVNYCRDHQINVIATWPNVLRFPVYNQKPYQQLFQSIEDFYKRIDIPLLGTAEQFMFDREMMYDTVYHLNSRGVRRRTAILIRHLEPYLNGDRQP